MKKLLSCMLLFFLLNFCKKESPPIRMEKPGIEKDDTLSQLKTRFKNTYFQISCMANEGIDPYASITPLKKPVQYLEGLQEKKSTELSKALQILRENGFSGIEDFKTVELELKKDREFWENIEVQFVDELLKCPPLK